jgi:hypothetical protein
VTIVYVLGRLAIVKLHTLCALARCRYLAWRIARVQRARARDLARTLARHGLPDGCTCYRCIGDGGHHGRCLGAGWYRG